MTQYEAPAATTTASRTTGGRRAPARLSTANHVGLVLATVLGLGDVVSVFSLGQVSDTSQPGPPVEVLLFCAVMGVLTVVAAAMAWAGRLRRPSLRVAAVARILSAITSLPAFFVDGVPVALVLVAAGGVLVTVVSVWLMLVRPRPHRVAA